MYNLKIKNHDTQITIRNSKPKYILDIINNYTKLGDFKFEVWSEEDLETSESLLLSPSLSILSNQSFKLEYLKNNESNKNKRLV